MNELAEKISAFVTVIFYIVLTISLVIFIISFVSGNSDDFRCKPLILNGNSIMLVCRRD